MLLCSSPTRTRVAATSTVAAEAFWRLMVFSPGHAQPRRSAGKLHAPRNFMRTVQCCAAGSKKEDPVVKTVHPVTRRELIRRSSLTVAGLATAPVLASTQPASAQGGVELVFWDSLFIEDE